MVLEWMASAAREAHPGLHVASIRDLAVLKGVVVEAATELVLAWIETPGPTLTFELQSDAPKGPIVHYRGTIELTAAASSAPRFPGSNGLGKERYPYPIDEAYRRFLFHGPRLRGIHEVVGYSDHGMVGKLRRSEPKSLGVDASAWATDPIVVDSALQMMVLWVREKRGSAALPCFLGEYRQLAPFAGDVTCHLEMSPIDKVRGRFDAKFVDAEGHVVATLTGGEYAANATLIPQFQAEA